MNHYLSNSHLALKKKLDDFCSRLEMVDSVSEDANVADSYISSWVTSKHAQLVSRHSAKYDKYMGKLEECGYFRHGLLEIISRGLIRQLGRGGFLKYVVPKQYGGMVEGIDSVALCLIRETLSYNSSLADAVFAIQGLGSFPIALAGTSAQKKKYLPKVALGQSIPAFAITEHNAGSDIHAIETTATARGNYYVLKGVKTFISNAGIADFYTVFAKTGKSPDSVTVFLVDSKTSGVRVSKRLDLMAPHPIGEISFNCTIPKAARVGRVGDGFPLAIRTLETFRTSVGAAALGMAHRAFDEALNYTQQRMQFGKKLSEFQAVKFELAELGTLLKASELMVFNAAMSRNKGLHTIEPSMAKLYATETAQQIIDKSLQLHGGIGVVKGSVIERLYREIRSLRIYEGTSEIQKVIIARNLLNPSRN